ncbi:hypothetical protein T08_14050 [Trichinella sp. T8]|nr:hypothetical protein T08_14050 [Trichinella sp. T8]
MEEISCLKGIFLNRRVIKTVLLTKKQNDRQQATLIVQWYQRILRKLRIIWFVKTISPDELFSFSLLKSGPYNGTDVNSVSCSADCLRQAIMIKRTAKRGYTTEQSIKWTMQHSFCQSAILSFNKIMYFTADAQLSTKNGALVICLLIYRFGEPAIWCLDAHIHDAEQLKCCRKFARCIEMNNSISLNVFMLLKYQMKRFQFYPYACGCFVSFPQNIMLLHSRKPAFQKCELIFTLFDDMCNYHFEMHTFCLNYTTYISDLLAFYTANKKDFPQPILNIKWRGCG